MAHTWVPAADDTARRTLPIPPQVPAPGHRPHPEYGRCVRHSRVASAVKHRPADVVPQPLIVKYEFTDSVRELVTLPLALASAGGLCLALWHGSTRGLDRIRSRTQAVRCNMCHGTGLACGVRGMPWGAT